MRIAVYSLTRDRLAYTLSCFLSLRAHAGVSFEHYVFDNGSEDGTLDWLRYSYSQLTMDGLYQTLHIAASAHNLGISQASNLQLHKLLSEKIDLVVKCDNDCLVRSFGILAEFERIYAECKEAARWVLSPRVKGINRQPRRVRQKEFAGHEIGQTSIVGGLFQVVPASIMREFMEDGGYDETLPLARGQDDQFAEWLRVHGYANGYVEDLVVEHYRGTDQQALDYPAYFRRKWDIEEVSKQSEEVEK